MKENKNVTLSEIQELVARLNNFADQSNVKSKLLKLNVYDLNARIKKKKLMIVRGFSTEPISKAELSKMPVPKKSRFNVSLKEVLSILNNIHNLEKAAVFLGMSVTAIHHLFFRKKLKLVRKYIVVKINSPDQSKQIEKAEKIRKGIPIIFAKSLPNKPSFE